MYSYETRVGFSETDSKLNLSLVELVNYFQDAAIFEAENGTMNMETLGKKHLAWLLNSWQIVIERMPRLNEKVVVSTMPYAFRGFIGYRNFMLQTCEGEILAKAASVWTLVDIEQVKPVRPTEEILASYEISEKIDMEYKPRKIKLLGEGETKEPLVIYKTQIDSNHHVNNAEYVNMAMNFLDMKNQIGELRVEYKTAAYLGEKIYPSVYSTQECVQVCLNNDKNEAYAIVEFNMKNED